MASDLSFVGAQETDTWPYVFNALLTTFITDDILQQAYQDVTEAQQRPKERVGDYILRLQDLARRCHGVLPQAELAILALRGMKPAIRSRIQLAVNSLPYREKTILPKIRQLAMENESA